MDFGRQVRIFNPDTQKSKIHVIGAGSTGSYTTLILAKLGFNNITVVDFDEVEEHNIPNQFYRVSDIGKPKVEALQEMVKDFTGTEINIENVRIDDDYEFDLELNSIIVFCLDNMETRKLIYEKIKEFPVKIVDTRMGGEGYQIYTVNLSIGEEREKFKKALDGVTAETVCGEKSVIYTINSIASETANIIKMIDTEQPYPKILKREMPTYRFICDLK